MKTFEDRSWVWLTRHKVDIERRSFEEEIFRVLYDARKEVELVDGFGW
jgi:hypothetical protein